MDSMLGFCDDPQSTKNVNAISGILNAAYSLGGIIGPVMGSLMSTELGFNWVCGLTVVQLAVASSLDGVVVIVCGNIFRQRPLGEPSLWRNVSSWSSHCVLIEDREAYVFLGIAMDDLC